MHVREKMFKWHVKQTEGHAAQINWNFDFPTEPSGWLLTPTQPFHYTPLHALKN